MFAKFATAVPTGAAMTLLLLGMHALISMQPLIVADTARPIDLDFIHVPPVDEPAAGPTIGVPTQPPVPWPGTWTLKNPITSGVRYRFTFDMGD